MRNVVVGYNATPACRTALALAENLARAAGATLHVVSVQVPIVPVGAFGWVSPYEDEAPLDDAARRRLREGTDYVGDDVDVARHAPYGRPATELARIAEEVDADLLVVGGVHRSLVDRVFLGSTAERIVRLAPVPCLVAFSDALPQRVLVAADDSSFGRRAVAAALRLAAACGASLRCVHVLESAPEDGPAGKDRSAGLAPELPKVTGHLGVFLERVREGLPDAPAIEPVVRIGDVRDEILAEVRESGADLLAVGTHGRGFVGRAVLGSVSETMLRTAPCSVLVAPGS